jgi:uncharacterized Zn-binding protein involved in type VI secretion
MSSDSTSGKTDAARVDDPVEHSSSFLGAVLGAVAGLVLGAAIVAFTVLTGGAGLVLVGAIGLACFSTVWASHAGGYFGGFFKHKAPGIEKGAKTVFIGHEKLPAARVKDPVKCHSGQVIVDGVEHIVIEGELATRVGAKTRCAGKIKEGEHTVHYCGPLVQVMPTRVGGETAPWFWYTREVVDWAGTVLSIVASGGWSAVSKLEKILTVSDVLERGIYYASTIAEQTGHHKVSAFIDHVTHHWAYKAVTLTKGAAGIGHSTRHLYKHQTGGHGAPGAHTPHAATPQTPPFVPPKTTALVKYVPPQTTAVTKYVPPQTTAMTKYVPPQTTAVTRYVPPQTTAMTVYVPPQPGVSWYVPPGGP